jgi:hypothetical protein
VVFRRPFFHYTVLVPDTELIRVLDYILNRCDEASIDAVAQAVVRRRRDLTMFGGSARLPDPGRMAAELSGRINAGATVEGMRKIVQDMAVRIIKQQAPELSDAQIAELTAAWIPGSAEHSPADGADSLPPALLDTMISQFVRFSTGRMSEAEDRRLRAEMEAWPERYWDAFPELLRLLIKDHLNGEIDEKDFSSRLAAALTLTNRSARKVKD